MQFFQNFLWFVQHFPLPHYFKHILNYLIHDKTHNAWQNFEKQRIKIELVKNADDNAEHLHGSPLLPQKCRQIDLSACNIITERNHKVWKCLCLET